MPSPLIAHIPVMPYSSIFQSEESSNLVVYEEPYDVPMHSTEALTGGTSLLANQAKCPFKAFAAHRLHAKEEHTSNEGLNAQERGQLIHGILETLWKTLQTQEILLHYPTDALNALIQKIVQESLQPIAQNHPHSFPDLLQSIEIQRLTELVYACLEWEKKRPTFVVEAVEHTSSIELAGLTFHVKIDRLDRLSSGKKWIIDYKSRTPEQKPWTQERPKEPQLLLYALLDEAIHGLLFIELRHRQISCCGLSEESTNIQGIKSISPETSWKNHHSRWKKQLSALALEFKEGHCVPDPSHTTTCNQCDFQSLCRTLHS
jgi:probable DNA repair protein